MTPTPTPVTLPETYTYEVIDDPATNAQAAAVHARALRNSQYLSAHWADVLPQAVGKYVAVANEQLFVADTVHAARACARQTDPDGAGLVQFVSPKTGPRVYGPLRRVADVP